MAKGIGYVHNKVDISCDLRLLRMRALIVLRENDDLSCVEERAKPTTMKRPSTLSMALCGTGDICGEE
jgi:hypothetical protein